VLGRPAAWGDGVTVASAQAFTMVRVDGGGGVGAAGCSGDAPPARSFGDVTRRMPPTLLGTFGVGLVNTLAPPSEADGGGDADAGGEVDALATKFSAVLATTAESLAARRRLQASLLASYPLALGRMAVGGRLGAAPPPAAAGGARARAGGAAADDPMGEALAAAPPSLTAASRTSPCGWPNGSPPSVVMAGQPPPGGGAFFCLGPAPTAGAAAAAPPPVSGGTVPLFEPPDVRLPAGVSIRQTPPGGSGRRPPATLGRGGACACRLDTSLRRPRRRRWRERARVLASPAAADGRRCGRAGLAGDRVGRP